MLSAFKKPPEDNYRKAIGLLIFCILSEIQIDPFFPVMENISFKPIKIDSSVEDLNQFYSIDNYSDLDNLMNYSLGNQDYLHFEGCLRNSKTEGGNKIRNWHKKYHSLKNWDFFYITCMKIVLIEQLHESNENKYKEFLLWEKMEYRFSFICAVFAMIIFSTNRVRGMNKFKQSLGRIERKEAIDNMVWDLYFIDYFIRKVAHKQTTEEFILASADKALCEICNLAIKITSYSELEELKKHIPMELFCLWQDYLKIWDDETIERYFPKDPEHQLTTQNNMKAEYESILGI